MSEYIDGDGFSAEEIFRNPESVSAYTYDDIILMPGGVNCSAQDVSLASKITKKIRLNLPILSSPMDTVTEHAMAIGMALMGGIGIIHYNMNVEEQAREVRLVKKYRNGFITDPACLSPEHTVADVDALKEKQGFSGIPITIDGKLGSQLVGIVTNRDIDFLQDRNVHLKDIMSTKLVTAAEGVSLAEANDLLKRAKKVVFIMIVPVQQLARLDVINILFSYRANFLLLTHKATSSDLFLGQI
jgi:IMP dehydrogenase